MRSFLVAFIVPWLGIFLVNLPSGYSGSLAHDRGLTLAATLLFAPFMSAWCMAILVHHRWPRRLLTPHHAAIHASLIVGTLAGIGSIVATALLLLIATRNMQDWPLTASASALATALTLLFTPKVRPGLCQRCNYDLCSSLEFGRCPECGTAFV